MATQLIKYEDFLEVLIEVHNAKNPNKKMDYDMLMDLHEHFYKSGLIGKDKKTGKYIVPEFIENDFNPSDFIKRIK